MTNREIRRAAVLASPAVGGLRAPKRDSGNEAEATLAALGKFQALIEFQMDGTVTFINDVYLNLLGFNRDEIVGRHHTTFVDNRTAQSNEYRDLWSKLNRGEFASAECKRTCRNGSEIWLHAFYNPIFGSDGKPFKVVALAFDITKEKQAADAFEAEVAAIYKSQAVIEFRMDGTIDTVNDNLLNALGYTLDEVRGKHHAIFVDEKTRQGAEYREFWAKLNRGEFVSEQCKRVSKNGEERWFHAFYNPVLGNDGKPAKVVTLAFDITPEKLASADHAGQIAAIAKSQATIEFGMDGTILNANENFLKTLGYTLDEIKGRHHSMFVDEAYRNSPEYRDFWARLNRGEYDAAEYKRIGKGGKEVWIQASYNPIFDLNGKPFKVVKYATDVTRQKLANANYAGQIAAINKSQAVIEFQMDGTIITANENFLKVLGYTLEEIKGRHHSMFVDEDYRRSADYREFWARLNRGEYDAAEYKRIGKGGRECWIQASYNPILDLNGKPFKVVKFATDVTAVRRTMNDIVQHAQTLGSSSEELTVISHQMASNAEETATQAAVVSAASDEVSKNVAVVASGSEEMLASIREISRSANESARVARNAVTAAETTNATIGKLGDSSAEIGKVIKVITSIAQQTNLLALNATIEAARAGEAGKGFAVVANEVKELAKETARATEEIGQKIDAIQTDTRSAVQAIGEISTIITQINDISNTIASAVEEQTATTNEIGRNVANAAKGMGEIASNISGVADAAKSTTVGATNTQNAAKALSGMATELRQLVARLKA
jgi:methyl-accepting chemotaxis protein